MAAPSNKAIIKVNGLRAQRRFWRSPTRYKAFVGGVGSGKTYAGIFEMLSQPGRTAGIVLAPTYPQMHDASQASFFKACPPQLIQKHNKSRNITDLVDGKRIYWRSADKPDGLRGPNLSWAWVDEGAYVKEAMWKILLGRLRVAKYGPTRAWVTTTPNGIDNWLYETFVSDGAAKFEKSGAPKYEVFKGSTADNHHNEEGYYEGLLDEYGDSNFGNQELEGGFVDMGAERRLPPHLFNDTNYMPEEPNGPGVTIPASLAIYTRARQGMPPELRIYRDPIPGRTYVGGADPAEGVGGDDSALAMKDKLTGETVALLVGQFEPEEVFPDVIAKLARHYNNASILPERNNHGHAISSGLKRLGIIVLDGPDGRSGWLTLRPSKVVLYDSYTSALLHGGTMLHDKRARKQLGIIHRVTLKSPEKGKKTKVDDEATAEVLANKARELGPVSTFAFNLNL